MFRGLLKLFPIHKYKITGHSMLPTLKPGQIVLVNRLAYLFAKPKADDLIAIKSPLNQKILIKRIKKNEKGKYLVAGDNPADSLDSRTFGLIGKKDIIGKVIYHLPSSIYH